MASVSFPHRYRCAVYLNNAATTFIARGDYQEACVTLREAISILETIVRPSSDSGSVVQGCQLLENFQVQNELKDSSILFKVHQVEKLLATSHLNATSPASSMELLCFDGSLDSRSILLKRQTRSQKFVQPIWISDLLVHNTDDVDELLVYSTDLVPAISLVNYAIATLCQYKSSKNQKMLDGSLRLFQLSMQALRIRDIDVRSMFHSDIDDTIPFMEERLFIAMAILRNFDSVFIVNDFSCDVKSIEGLCISAAYPSNLMLWYNTIHDIEELQDITDELLEYTSTVSISTFCHVTNASAA